MNLIKIDHSTLGKLNLEVRITWSEWKGNKLGYIHFYRDGEWVGEWDEDQGGGLHGLIEYRDEDEIIYLELEDRILEQTSKLFPYFFTKREHEIPPN